MSLSFNRFQRSGKPEELAPTGSTDVVLESEVSLYQLSASLDVVNQHSCI